MIKQISIFTENKKGAMLNVTKTISESGISLFSAVTNDSAEYGIVRLVVSDPEKCFNVLNENGYLCKLTDVIAIEITDDAGSLTNLLDIIDKTHININYLYSAYDRESGKPLVIIHTPDAEIVEKSLKSKGMKIH